MHGQQNIKIYHLCVLFPGGKKAVSQDLEVFMAYK